MRCCNSRKISPSKTLGFLLLWVCLTATGPLAHGATGGEAGQADAAYEKALISFHGGDVKTAKIHLKNALKANPRHLSSRILMAEVLIKNRDGAGAEVELEYARDRGADYDSLITLFGYAYILQGKHKHLLDVIRSGNRDINIEAEIHYLRGRAYFGQKSLANARRSYARALDMNPRLLKATLGLAQVASIHENYDLALQYIDQVLDADKADAEAWILKAKIYNQLGEMQKSTDAINKALALDDTNVLARLTRAALYVNQKKFDDATLDVDYILEFYPREPQARYLQAIIAAAKGDFNLSNTSMTEIIAILRSLPPAVMAANPAYYYLAGLTNFQFGNLDEARINLQQYLKIKRTDTSAMRLLGVLELQDGKAQAANVILSQAIRIQPENPTILTMLGMVHLELGNNDKANYYLETVTKLVPESSKGLANLARGEMMAGSFNAAIANLLKAEQHNLDAVDVKLLLVKAYQNAGKYDKAVDIIQALKQKNPDNAFLIDLYGTAVGLTGNLAEARKSYEAALALDKDNITSLIHLARMDVIGGKADSAIKILRDQLAKMPDDYNLMIELGNIYKLINDPENTLFWYKKAFALNSKNFATLNYLVEGYLLNKDTKAAIETTNRFVSIFPKHAKAYSLLGKLYQRAGKPDEAVKSFKLAVEYAVKRGDALLALANAQIRANDRRAAANTLLKAVAWNPALTDAYIALIKMAIKDKNRKSGLELIAHLRTIIKKENPAAHILSGDLYLALKEYAPAEKAYLAALDIGDSPLAVMGLYNSYQQAGNRDKAVVTLEKWQAKYPTDMVLAVSLGNAYKLAGRLKKSVDFHEELLAKNPDMAILLNNAASVNFEFGNKDKGLAYARKANEVMPNNANILDTLAWIESRMGNPETALPMLRKALVLKFTDPEIKYHLAMTLDKLDRRGEARKLLSDVIASQKNFPERDIATQTLKQWREN